MYYINIKDHLHLKELYNNDLIYQLLSFTSLESHQTSIHQTSYSVLNLFAFDVKLLVINESGDFFIISSHKVVYENCLLSSILLSREKKLPINHVTSGNCNVE